ncbi:helix-turn-helix domain-containing protein [Chryseolinea sp. T2]|uniref:helix-turn-helix domain-containing protein n=1 Tax=Chryseolinea sp. T2 TaxID=3129255 RepID=UPI003FCE35EE
MSDEILTPAEVCSLLGIARRTLDRKISKRQLPFIKVPSSNKVVFSKSALIEFLKTGSRPVEGIA